MGSDHTFGTVSGGSADDCHVLGYRGPEGEGFRPDRGESFVLWGRGDRIDVELKKSGWYTDLWRSPAGRVYVVDADGFIQVSQGRGQPWTAQRVPGMLVGIWGLDDEHVYAWGLRKDQDFMVRYDGSVWTEMAAPQGGIVAVHGSSPDLIVAVGDRGLIARWNGSGWTSMVAPSDEPLRSVFVANEDEIWATGNRGGLLSGTVYGWTEVLRHDAPLSSVARWRETVWVGAHGDFGLCRLNGTRLETHKKSIVAAKLAVSGDVLLWWNVGAYGHSLDGDKFTGYRPAGFAAAAASQVAPWD